MTRRLLTILLLAALSVASMRAQVATARDLGIDANGNQLDPTRQLDTLTDTTTEIISLPPKLFMWTISETLGTQNLIPVDTASLNFQNSNMTDGMTGHYNFLGNLGSPRLSRLYYEREQDKGFTMFTQPYSYFIQRPDQMLFTNSNIPYTNLSYYKAGGKIDGEERFKSYFSANVNKRFAFGFKFDYLYGRGKYANQATAHFNAGIFASYTGQHYQMHAILNNYALKMNENGGITDDRYVTNPESMSSGKKQYESSNIPVTLQNTSNRNHDGYLYYTQRYRIGFTRRTITQDTVARATTPLPEQLTTDNPIGLGNDSKAGSMHADTTRLTLQNNPLPQPEHIKADTLEEFIPVTSLIHTLKLERASHRFYASNEPEGFFPDAYTIAAAASRDTTTAVSVKNVFGIALLEGFNKYAKAGLTAYISHKLNHYSLMNTDNTLASRPAMTYDEQEVFVGGELAKRQGHMLHYRADGEVGLVDKAAGQFRVTGDLDFNMKLGQDTVSLYLRGFVSNTLPDFYMRHYHSNHYNWDNELDKEMRTRLEGEVSIRQWGTNLMAGVENIKNYTYLNSSALPAQYADNIQVANASLRQDFRLGILHLDNEVVWQKSSNEEVLPLPQLSLYHNLYILTAIAKKVLNVQLGADVRYFTKYYAPAYAPGIQQFHLQDADNRVELGGYPMVNVYANLQLKRTRFYIMMTHVSDGKGNRNSFLVPHYPINPQMLRFGVSWNFYD